jgi:hypothetical protein
VDNANLAKIPLKIQARQAAGSSTDISVNHIRKYHPSNFYYDAELDGITPAVTIDYEDISYT